ncbi:hypothetical protein [Salinarimonas soli]|nr:hypothetical protein [Salinarimonas soli]
MTRPARSLTPLDLLLGRLLAELRPVAPVRVPLDRALGHACAESIVAPEPVPGTALARRSGWAVASHDTVGASSYAPAFATASPVAVVPGASLPPGLDAVLGPADLSFEGAVPEILAAVAPGEGVRRPGEDMGAGAVLRAAGEPLRPLDLALARAIGRADLPVRRPVAVLWAPDGGPAGALVAGELSGLASVIAAGGPTPPDEGDIVVGVGDDATALGIERLCDRGGLLAHGVAIAPGEAAACGILCGRPVILLPSRLEDAFAAYHLLVRPCLDRLRGAPPRRPDLTGPLVAKLASAIGLAEIALLRREPEGLRPIAVGDLAWSALAAADAWTVVPPALEGHAPGETIAAFALDWGP